MSASITPARWKEMNARWHDGGEFSHAEVGDLLDALREHDPSLAAGGSVHYPAGLDDPQPYPQERERGNDRSDYS